MKSWRAGSLANAVRDGPCWRQYCLSRPEPSVPNLQVFRKMDSDNSEVSCSVSLEHPEEKKFDPELIVETDAVTGVEVNHAKSTELLTFLVEHFENGNLLSHGRLEARLWDIRKLPPTTSQRRCATQSLSRTYASVTSAVLLPATFRSGLSARLACME